MPEAVFDLDFKDAPPAQGGFGSDKVPEGRYRIKVDKIEKTTSRAASKPMAVITLRIDSEPAVGKKLVERFTFPRPDTDDSRFGLQRFHALLIALGYKELDKKMKIEGRMLLGRSCVAEVEDSEMPASDNYPARIVSSCVAFHRNGPAPEAKAAPEAEAEPEEKPKATAKAKAAAKAEAEQATLPDDDAALALDGTEAETPGQDDDDVASGLDELFE